MNATSPRLQDRFDEFERSLPPFPAKMLRFQRDLAERVERDTTAAIRRMRRAWRRADPRAADNSPGLDNSLSRAELYRRAQQAQIPGRSSMNKAELLAALRHA